MGKRKLSQKPGFLDGWAIAQGLRNRVSQKNLVRMPKLSQKPGFLDGWAIALQLRNRIF
ncbi:MULTISPECIES: hypothetical protein [unclassified Microcoleus]|uniref:hypothetical protein n=1 Tax=unclassified Microcoleus TaxID=2642155 RepID=UPI001DB2C963|nr:MULTISPECIES: hypothetical protein [unclassified Microcoleus]MCC3459726.1 hypothetical protein [Microcoleus sp. PH2017_11_PCY_U_A]